MFSLDDITGRAIALKAKVQQEDEDRAKIKYTPEYQELDRQVQELSAKRDGLLATVPDSRAEHDAAIAELTAAFTEAKVNEHMGVKATFREKSEVNAARLLTVLDGDIDNFMVVASVTQIKLKDLAKTFPAKKKELMDCVEVVEKKIVGFSFPTA